MALAIPNYSTFIGCLCNDFYDLQTIALPYIPVYDIMFSFYNFMCLTRLQNEYGVTGYLCHFEAEVYQTIKNCIAK